MFRCVMKVTVRYITIVVFNFLSIINKFLPKRSNSILLYHNIKGFNDNNRALFEHLVNNNFNSKYKIYYSSPDTINKVVSEVDNVYFVSTYRGLFLFFFSKYCFYDAGTLKVKPSKKQVVISLWHGTPLKRIGRAVEKSSINDRYNDFTKITCTSESLIKIFAKSFECKESDVIVTGYPRNDNLFNTQDYLHLLGVNNDSYSKKIIWMPTHRVTSNKRYISVNDDYNSLTGIPLFPKNEDLQALDEFLNHKSVFLCIKIHPLSLSNSHVFPDFKNIKIINNDTMLNINIQNYLLLSNFDALITDYSSVYFDYLLLERPIGFIVDDLGMYRDSRGFSFDNPLELMPGPKITDDKMLHYFINNLIEDHDEYESQRTKVKNMMNKYLDDGSSRRILEYCNIKL